MLIIVQFAYMQVHTSNFSQNKNDNDTHYLHAFARQFITRRPENSHARFINKKCIKHYSIRRVRLIRETEKPRNASKLGYG